MSLRNEDKIERRVSSEDIFYANASLTAIRQTKLAITDLIQATVKEFGLAESFYQERLLKGIQDSVHDYFLAATEELENTIKNGKEKL